MVVGCDTLKRRFAFSHLHLEKDCFHTFYDDRYQVLDYAYSLIPV